MAFMAACDFGVMRTLNVVWVVVTGIGVPPEKMYVSPPAVEEAVKYVVPPEVSVMRRSPSAAPVPAVSVTVRPVTESVDVEVWSVNASISMMTLPGATVELPGFVPSLSVVRRVMKDDSDEYVVVATPAPSVEEA